jgi:hypothetical protein
MQIGFQFGLKLAEQIEPGTGAAGADAFTGGHVALGA